MREIHTNFDQLFMEGRLGDISLGESCATICTRYEIAPRRRLGGQEVNGVRVGWIDLDNVQIYCAGRGEAYIAFQFVLLAKKVRRRHDLLVRIDEMRRIKKFSAESTVIDLLRARYYTTLIDSDKYERIYKVGIFGKVFFEVEDDDDEMSGFILRQFMVVDDARNPI